MQKAGIIIYIVSFLLPLLPLAGGEYLEKNPERRAGDNAFSAKDYAVAASFYQKYLAEALRKQDNTMERDARERMLDALALGGMTDAAEEYLEEYRKKYPDANANFLLLWQGEIQTGKKQFREAKKTYEKLLSSITNPRDPLRIRILFAYGQVLENMMDFPAAAKVYEQLQSLPLSSELGKNAFIRRLLSLASAGKCEEAEGLLLSHSGASTGKDRNDYRLIHAYIYLKKNGAMNNAGLWKTILGDLPRKPDPLAYLVSSSYGDAFSREKMPETALDSYRAAFQCATDNSSMSETLTRIISCVSNMGDKQLAASLAEKQLDLFRETLVKPENKLPLAALLVQNGKVTSGLLLYDSLLQSVTTPEPIREKAFTEYLNASIREGSKDKAIAYLRKLFQSRKEIARGEQLLAEALENSGAWQEACTIYLSLGQNDPVKGEKLLLKGAFLALEKKDRIILERFLAPLRKTASAGKEELQTLLFYLEGCMYAFSQEYGKALQKLKKFIASPGRHTSFLPQALYNGAMSSFASGDVKTAEELLKELSRKYASSPLGAPGNRWLIHLYFTTGNEIAAEREVWLLAERHPRSSHASEAILQLVKYHREKGSYDKAREALAQLLKQTDEKTIQARILYEQSLIARKMNDLRKVEILLEKLFRNYPESPILPEALYLRGDVEKSKGDFLNAAKYYGMTLDRSKGTLLELAAQGALGDTYFARGQTEPEALRQALISYLTVADNERAPRLLRAGAICKAGKCRELLGEWEEASLLYKQLLYMTSPRDASGDPAALVWYVKSAEALIDMALKHPVRSAFENARMALHFLHDASLLTRKEAEERFEALKKRKFQP